MKKVLILTYYWPPGSGPGVQRWLKFCKYLPQFGWQPTVITVKNGSYPSTDDSLENDIPENLEVIKTQTFEPFALYNLLRGKKGKSVEVAMGNLKSNPSLFSKISNYVRANYFIPDARVGWNAYSFKTAARWIDQHKPEVIVTTGPPHSTHLVGQALKKEFGVGWVADFRDPWTTINYNSLLNRTNRSKEKDLKLETSVLKDADVTLTATPGMINEFKDRAQKIECILNGFDSDDFETPAHNQSNDKFTLAYVGNFKSNQDVKTLWKALANVRDSEADFSSKFRLRIIGNVQDAIVKSLNEAEIMDIVTIEGFMSHNDAVGAMKSAHMLLLPVPMGKDNKMILTGKIFEYLATRRPILGIGPIGGNADDVLKDANSDGMIDYNDIDGMCQKIKQGFNAFKEDSSPHTISGDAYLKYGRRSQSEALATLLNSVNQG